MKSLTASLLFIAAALPAQTFDPAMPASVPAVSGKAVDAFGLHYIEIKMGDGAPALPGQEYTVHYTGWLRNGTKFDSSVDRGTPLSFIQGRRNVIAGWDLGFEGMRVGGKRRLYIPYQLAYGEQARGNLIPAKAELIFDVELLGVKNAAPAPSPGADLNLQLPELEEHVMSLAKAVPEEKYSWRPGPGVRSFQEVFLHIANGNQLLLNVAANSPESDVLRKQIEDNAKGEGQPATKEKILTMLADSFHAVHAFIDSARAATMNRDVNFFGRQVTARATLISLETHVAEHLGQAIAYARMNGIVPPWSK
jgi:peptidylprolyl isomerase